MRPTEHALLRVGKAQRAIASGSLSFTMHFLASLQCLPEACRDSFLVYTCIMMDLVSSFALPAPFGGSKSPSSLLAIKLPFMASTVARASSAKPKLRRVDQHTSISSRITVITD